MARMTISLVRALAAPLALAAVLACSSTERTDPSVQDGPVPAAVLDEVAAMATEDQRWERLVIERAPETSEVGFFARKIAMQDRHAARCKEIFERHGRLSQSRVGEDRASDFWVMVQHAARAPAFQGRVLAALDAGVDPAERAYLVDRVRVNTGRGQLYGTQVGFDTGRPEPKPIEDPKGVDARRAAGGLAPLLEYMNGARELHFQMNRQIYLEEGVESPELYPEGWSDWPASDASR